MIITVLSAVKTPAVSKAGKPYTYLELAYKDGEGKVQGKKVMPFGESKPVFEALGAAGAGENFNISLVKNEASGYWDWTAASKAAPGTIVPVASATDIRQPAGKITGSNYETSEERAKRQVYIVRQSSITAALTLISLQGRKTGITPQDVLDVAKEFENHVFDIKPEPAAAVDIFEDDIPL